MYQRVMDTAELKRNEVYKLDRETGGLFLITISRGHLQLETFIPIICQSVKKLHILVQEPYT